MPLSIEQLQRGRYRPVVICDQCGLRIDDSRQGRFQWQVDGETILTGRILYTHSECTRQFEVEHAGQGHWMWAPLAVLPAYLAKHLGIDWRDSERLGELLAEL